MKTGILIGIISLGATSLLAADGPGPGSGKNYSHSMQRGMTGVDAQQTTSTDGTVVVQCPWLDPNYRSSAVYGRIQ